MSNGSSITDFLLLTFLDTRELQLLTFGLFLGIYLAALLGSALIITTVACDPHLHTPMYFFLLNLSVLDLGSLSTTLPKAMANALWNTRAISYMGCVVQLFLFFFLISAEHFLLTVMAYDRYVAICNPLHYGTLLGSRACVHMAAAAWGSGFLNAVLHTANTFSLPLCQGNAVDQFFCEIPQILKLSCSDTYLREAGLLVVGVCLGFVCFVFIVVSYVQIFRAVLRIPSEQGRHKAFSTCLPHLAVVSLLVSTGMFTYLKPPSISYPLLNILLAVLYSVVPPAVNPLIYSMRNQELKDALRKLITVTEGTFTSSFYQDKPVSSDCHTGFSTTSDITGTFTILVIILHLFWSSLLNGRFLMLLGGGCPSQVCVLLLAFLAPLSCLAPRYFLVKTAKADTDYSVPEQLFLVCQDQGSTDFSEGKLGTDPDQNAIVPRAVSAVLRSAARTAWPSNPHCAAQIPWKQDNLSSMWSHKSLEAAPTL
ncbi:olfactory receptor 14A16-like [Leptosomus discolor]